MSFLVIGAIWINHHAMFRHIVRSDGVLLLLNVLHLMLIAFLPFPTAVPAEAFSRGSERAVAASFYGGMLTVLGILVNVLWRYAAHRHRLLGAHVTAAEAGRIGRRFLLLNVFYLWPRHVAHGEAA